jgi:hypothetical protein
VRTAGSADVRPSSFFVAYAHEDAAYAHDLVRHLGRFDLPLWFDANMAWGDRFTLEIRQRLRCALAIIVIMSPDAEASTWVEREILEGLRHDRDFLPILLRGELLFLLGSSSYFDARDGALPGEREISQLQAIRAKDPTGTGSHPRLVLPRPVAAPDATSGSARRIPPDVSLRKLRSFLANGEVAHADIVTTALLLEAAGRLGKGFLRRDDGERLPFPLLDLVDRAWSEFSRGRQGFLAQVARHRRPLGQRPGREFAEFVELAISLGWKATQNEHTGLYGEFVGSAGDHVGFFPTLRNPQAEVYGDWHDQWMLTAIAVHVRLRRWGGQQ